MSKSANGLIGVSNVCECPHPIGIRKELHGISPFFDLIVNFQDGKNLLDKSDPFNVHCICFLCEWVNVPPFRRDVEIGRQARFRV